MALDNASKTSCRRSCDKYVSSDASNISLDESDVSIPTNDINGRGNSYVNTPSPSSIASTSTIDNSFKYRPSSLKTDYRSQMFSKRHYRHDRLFHHTNSLNRQYVIAMTNILFQMQKDIYKLKKRTHRVEQMLAKQTQVAHPIIRIPRLTRDELSTICINDDENQKPMISEENTNISDSEPPTTNNTESSNEHKDDTESSVTLQTEHPTNVEINPQQTQFNYKNKYCSACNHEFSHRSGYLRHIKNIHKGRIPTTSDNDNPPESDSFQNETILLTNDQSLIYSDGENGSLQILVNQWDIGEGRLRPRRLSKLSTDTPSKVKCDICSKFFRAEYITKHKRRAHHIRDSSPSSDLNGTPDPTKSTVDNPMEGVETISNPSPTNNTDPPSSIAIAEMNIDDMAIEFSRHTNKRIVIATTCLERCQLDIIDEFLKKFSSNVCQTSSVDSQTTHLIINDAVHSLRSPLSMKLIEGVANHCFCVSYRWVIECLKYDRILDAAPFEIEGDDTDSLPHGGPKRSRLVNKRHSLFENICFMIKCTENNDIKLTNDRLQELITTCGGQIITCVTQTLLNQYVIVVLCDKLYVSERRHNYDQCRQLGIHFVSSDWVLESILEYRQKAFSLYEETPL